MRETERPGSRLILEPELYPGALRRHGSGANVVSVLFDRTADEWRSEWRAEVGWEPRREAMIDLHGLSRSAAAASSSPTTQVLPNRDVAVTRMERPVDPETVVGTVGEYLSPDTDHETLVYVDALGELLEDAAADDVVTAVEALSSALVDAGATAYLCLDPTAVDADVREALAAAVTAVHGDVERQSEAERAVETLRREDPTNYGYACRHWREAQRGIEACTRNYPQARQIHEAVVAPETTTRTLGATLQAFVTLGVIDTWGDTVGATRYDLTAYDPDRLQAVSSLLDDAK